jgi:hypothetical protein
MFRWRIGRGIIGTRVLMAPVVLGWGWGVIKGIGRKFDPWGFDYHGFLRISYYLGGCRHLVVFLLYCVWYSYQGHVNILHQHRILQLTVWTLWPDTTLSKRKGAPEVSKQKRL